MSSFRHKFEGGLGLRGIGITHDVYSSYDAILVIAGTRHLPPLIRARRRGLRVVQRLDGINWIHRRRNTGAPHFLRAEYGNLILRFIRARVATHIVYQSHFTRGWWQDWYGRASAPSSVVHNGVDLEQYRPLARAAPSSDRLRLLVVEGNLGGGYDMGLENAVELAGALQAAHGIAVELQVVGKIEDAQRSAAARRSDVPIRWEGVVPPERIAAIDSSAHVLFSADLNAACPNSVVEALACGLPVVAFDTGALKELVLGDAGRIVPYGADPWKLQRPDIAALAAGAAEILRHPGHFRRAARAHAEQALGLGTMMDGYLKALLEA